jgi:hypothetical protein
MALLTKPNELKMKETFVGLVYGQPGVGKTTLALSSVNPVCIDVDKGMYRVEKRYQVPSLQVESYQEVLDLFNSGEMDGFDTIVLDTLGKLIDRIGDYVAKNNPKYRQSNGQLTMQGWGQVKIEFHALIKLINGKNKSVIFVAHESEEKEGDVTKKRPDVSGSARKDIVKELDFMGYMEMSGNKRTISFAPSSAYYAKNSMGLDSVLEIPGIQTKNSFIKDVVVSALKSRREQDEAQAGPYDEIISQIDGFVSSVKDIPTINEAYGKITGLSHVWDSKIYAWSKISEVAKAINATWDKVAKQFTGPAVTSTPPAAAPKAPAVSPELKPILEDIERILSTPSPDQLLYFTQDEIDQEHALSKGAGNNIKTLQSQQARLKASLEKKKAEYTPVPFDDGSEPPLPAMYEEPEGDNEIPPDTPAAPINTGKSKPIGAPFRDMFPRLPPEPRKRVPATTVPDGEGDIF